MARKFHKVEAFHGGLNSKSDARDIGDTQLSEAIDVSIDDVGKITNAGSFTTVTNSASDKPAANTSAKGYGLFRFSSDYHKDWDGNPATGTRTDYLLGWRDADKKLYWSADGADWETPTHLDTSSDWAGGSENPQPIFYNVDGAIRMSDAGLNSGNNSLWVGAIDRTLFTDASTTVDVKEWFKTLQELTAPVQGYTTKTAPSSLVGTERVHWHIRNIRESTTSVPAFDSASAWTMTDTSGEHYQTQSRQGGGFEGTFYRRLGWRLANENDDDAEQKNYWTSPDFSNSTVISTGKAAYVALRLEDMDNRDMWMGTHSKIVDENQAWSITLSNPKIQLYDDSDNWIRWEIPLTNLFLADPGEWVVLELPYDEVTEKSGSGDSTLTPIKFSFIADMAIDLTGSGSVTTTSDFTDSSLPVMQISDLRIGDTEKTGSSGAKGSKKFAYSFVYDENDSAESLLFSMPTQAVSLHPNDFGYKIGITGHVRNAWTNKRITGANLYMIEDDIPYRIAQLNFIKGLKGSWESEFPADKLGSSVDAFATEHTSGSKSNSIETTGLPLLESYESLNGFKPTVDTISAKYKTAVVLNRKVYIGNIEQNGKKYGDRMIKSVTNSFDCFPSVGREIDVVVNDGDDIIKLEAYADRILQFKRGVMYLINATKVAEFLEDTFVGKGVVHPGAVCKTDFGIAWVNENGCYLYDGQKVNNLTEGAIHEDDWANHVNVNSQIFYYPNKRKLFVTGDWSDEGTASDDMYEYCLTTNGWTKIKARAPASTTNYVLDVDNIIKTLDSSGNIKKWDDTVQSSTSYEVRTGDIDFGNPGTVKRVYGVYLTYKSPSDTNIYATFDTNGGTSYGYDFETGNNYAENNLQGTSSSWAEAVLRPDTSSESNNIKSFQLKLAANGTVPSTFEINDMTIVYRERSIR